MSLNQEEEKYIEQLYREMYTRLCFYAKNALGSRTLAEETVQDTFRIACIKPDSLMNSQNPHGWLINTLKNVIRNRQRTEARLSNALLVAMSVCEPQAKANVETAEFHAAYSDALGKDDFQLLINIVIRKYSMLEAAEEDGVNLTICSPYRDLEYQQMLFNRKIKRYMNRGMSYMEAYQLSSQAVTVPGASEHQIGLALDIVCNDYMSLDEGFGDTKAGKWLATNSCRFGFILRYPKGKEDITGIEYEPWHFRYVGKTAAPVIMEQGITLEEFWEEYVEDVSID